MSSLDDVTRSLWTMSADESVDDDDDSDRDDVSLKRHTRSRLYILFEKYIYILASEMASPGNRHCASCIGTLSFPTAF